MNYTRTQSNDYAGLVGIGVILALVGQVLLKGWVLKMLWGWFVVPVFDLVELPIAAALGISLLISEMAGIEAPEKDGDAAAKILYAFLRPLFALALGWVFSLFM